MYFLIFFYLLAAAPYTSNIFPAVLVTSSANEFHRVLPTAVLSSVAAHYTKWVLGELWKGAGTAAVGLVSVTKLVQPYHYHSKQRNLHTNKTNAQHSAVPHGFIFS